MNNIFSRKGSIKQALLSLTFLFYGFGLPSTLLAEGKPNFVIILADDAAWSNFGSNQEQSGLFTNTPNIDNLATQGVRFTNFFAAVAQCGPVRHELYTGLHPTTSGVYRNGMLKPEVDYDNVTDYLGNLGYRVGLTGKTHFKKIDDFERIPGFDSNGNGDAPTWDMSGVKEFIESSQAESKPFCVVIASVHAHHPWTIGDPSKYINEKILPPHMVETPLTREAIARHAAEVEDLDNQVGATMDLLDEMNLTDNTVLVFLSEQGTAMPNGKSSIYDFGTKALCVMRWPGQFAPAVTDAIAMYSDVVPTLVDIAGGETPATDGTSFLRVLKGEKARHLDHAYLIHQYEGYAQRAIREKRFKFIYNPLYEFSYGYDAMMNPGSNKFFAQAWQEWLVAAETDSDAQEKVDRVLWHPQFELYNIKKDPWELNNLADDPKYQQRVQDMYNKYLNEFNRRNDDLTKGFE